MPEINQLSLFDPSEGELFTKSPSVLQAVEDLASGSGIEARGAIFTRIEVVEFILDLIGYTENAPLYRQSILEPSFGSGDFLLPMVDRLLAAWQRASGNPSEAISELGHAICGVELHRESHQSTRCKVMIKLVSNGIPEKTASELADRWLVQGDFLLESLGMKFDYIAGNPPYVRQELIPEPLLKEYRLRYRTLYDRADLYIPFIERSLLLLKNNGQLGFICADRWMKNRYGGPLRRLISLDFHLKAYVDMVGTQAFHSEVSAYPAITIINRNKTGVTRIAHRPPIERKALEKLSAELNGKELSQDSSVREIACVANGVEPWLLESCDQMELIRRLESEYPLLEDVGCKVGIGVATGADKAFIGDYDSLDVEPDRKLALATTRDIRSGEVTWKGLGVVNSFAEDGKLVNLSEYPRLSRYLEARKNVIAKRHCARKAPANWYRTIDRIWPYVAKEPKLLIPDIKGEAHIVFEEGKLYPHHNLYYVISSEWNLQALQAVLLSSITKLFVATYSTRMRGGYLRFQAQYLRRVRVPFWKNVGDDLREELIQAAKSRDMESCNKAAFKLYELSKKEQAAVGGNGI